jgi:hypothetical protein
MYLTGYEELPALARDEQRSFWSTPRHARSVRDEFSMLRTAMGQAKALTGIGDRPLMVLTAEKDAEGGWMPAQNDLAVLSTNSAHRVLHDATHAAIVEEKTVAVQSSRAIRDVVSSVRAGTPVAA